MKAAFDIPSITDSLRAELDAGKITFEGAASELCRAGMMNFVDLNKAAQMLKLNEYNPICYGCKGFRCACSGTKGQHFTGCVYRT